MNKSLKDIIGSGGLYPIQLTANSNGEYGWHPVNGDPKLIENNLCSLVSYEIGQRFRQENFGTRLWECIDEPNTQALNFLVNHFLTQAISIWENRITYKGSVISREGSKLYIKFSYVINETNTSKSATLTYDSITNSLNS